MGFFDIINVESWRDLVSVYCWTAVIDSGRILERPDTPIQLQEKKQIAQISMDRTTLHRLRKLVMAVH